MSQITLRGFTDLVKIEAEAKAIERATQHTEQVLTEYANRPETFGGRYVCADSFKELMPGFAQSRESRSALNGAVHNAAAVLAAEQFRRLVSKGSMPGRDTVVFVTGIPGAGKSSTVAGALQSSAAVIFEGQMSRPEPAMMKIEQALEKGFKVEIVAVHVAPEVALDRTHSRFLDPNNGRGASLNVMADIQGNLPAGLRQISERFRERVQLTVLDNNPGQRKTYDGWENIRELEKEGSHEDIRSRLTAALESGYREGRYSADFYTQAAGHQPPSLEAGIGSQDGRIRQPHGDRPRIPQANSKHDALNKERAQAFRQETPEKAVQKFPELAPALKVMDEAARYFEAKMPGNIHAQRQALAQVRQHVQAKLDQGETQDFRQSEQTRQPREPARDTRRTAQRGGCDPAPDAELER